MARFYQYATDSPERDTLTFYFAGAGIALAYGLHRLIEAFHPTVPWYVDIPSPIVFYDLVRRLFAHVAWKWRFFRAIGLVRIPNLNGRYEGHLTSSHDNHGHRHKCELHIKQSWTGISIRGVFEHSVSYNLVTGISVKDTDIPRLTYEYTNEPRAGAVETMNVHSGTVWLEFHENEEAPRLTGDYYTGRGRGTVGSIEVRRISQ